jgi:hypothetical protein
VPAHAPQVLADPLKVVVDLVRKVEPGLDRQAIGEIAQRVAAGRAKRRRLAQALLDTPALLVDGRSPAPRSVGNLLIALRQAGALNISPPVCAACGKALRTLQRRGEHWYCGSAVPGWNRARAAGRYDASHDATARDDRSALAAGPTTAPTRWRSSARSSPRSIPSSIPLR